MLGTILIVGGVLVGIIIIGYIISIYNSLIRLKHNIEKAWSNIDVLLKQRHDELTKLMKSVKGYMAFEKKVLTDVTAARTAFTKAKTVSDKAKLNSKISELEQLFINEKQILENLNSLYKKLTNS